MIDASLPPGSGTSGLVVALPMIKRTLQAAKFEGKSGLWRRLHDPVMPCRGRDRGGGSWLCGGDSKCPAEEVAVF